MELRDWVQIQMKLLRAQMRILRNVDGGSEEETAAPTRDHDQRRSKIGIVEDILKEAGQPLHITQIIQIASQRFNCTLDRDSLVSALTKKVRKGDTFIRAGRNTFGLLSR